MALVMILSAFAGTFVIHAEEAPGAFEIDGTFYNNFMELCNKAKPGDTIKVHKDFTIPKGNDSDPYYWLYDVIFEGVQKADGTYPTLTSQMRYHRIYFLGECTVRNLNFTVPDHLCTGVLQVMNYAKNGTLYSEASHLYVENINATVVDATRGDKYAGGFLRLREDNTSAHLKNCKITVSDKFKDDEGLLTGLFQTPSGVVGTTLTLENTTVDASLAQTDVSIIYYLEPENKVIFRNSTLVTGGEAPICFPEKGLDIEYVGTNTINGQVVATEDMLGDEIADRKARAAGYIARVGSGREAIGEDESFPGYYKDLVEACKASAATEDGKQKTVYLIDDITYNENLTLPTAIIDGLDYTLTTKRIYKEADAILEVSSLNIVTTTEAPIFQMNADVAATSPTYAKFTKCTFTTDQQVPYAYFVQRCNMILDRCTINITHATCDKPIFRLENGADVTLSDTTLDTSTTAPNLIGFDIIHPDGCNIILNGETKMALGATVFTGTSANNTSLAMGEEAVLSSANADAIVVPQGGTAWGLNIGGKASIISHTGTAISVTAPNLAVTIGGNAKVSGAVAVLHAAAEGVSFVVESGATVEMVAHAKNKAAVLLEGEGSMLVSNGTITALGLKPSVYSISLASSFTRAQIMGGTVNNAVSIGANDAMAQFVMTGGKIVAQESAASAIILNNGDAYILSGTLSGGAAAISGQKELAYADGTNEITLNELLEKAPTMGEVTMRMNTDSLGMRFTSMISAEALAYIEELKTAGVITAYEYGTLIARVVELRNVEMTHAALTAGDVIFASVLAKDGIVTNADGSVTYTAAVINFTEENMGSTLTARAYVKYTFASGAEFYVYAEDRTEGISIGEVAQKCLADVRDASAEGYRNRVESYYEADEDGWYELIMDTAYSPYSKEQQAALAAFVEKADF